MHEMAITEQILNIAVRSATEAGGHQVTDLHLVLGELSTFVDDSVQFYWDVISQGTLCAGSQLHFVRIPTRLQCQSCQTQFGLSDGTLTPCPHCGGGRVDILTGQEFYLDSVEIASEPSRPHI